MPEKLAVALNIHRSFRSFRRLDSRACFLGCRATEETNGLCDLGVLLWHDAEEVILEREKTFSLAILVKQDINDYLVGNVVGTGGLMEQ